MLTVPLRSFPDSLEKFRPLVIILNSHAVGVRYCLRCRYGRCCRASKKKFFGAKEFFHMIFDFKNGCKNEFNDNNEKSCSCSRK